MIMPTGASMGPVDGCGVEYSGPGVTEALADILSYCVCNKSVFSEETDKLKSFANGC